MWSAADSKSVIWSMEDMSPVIRIRGVDVKAVDRRGRDCLRPQSPFDKEDWVVSMVAYVGYGRVAVSESALLKEIKS